MSQRLRSQQNSVVDIAPEQYQQLRQRFLSTLTLPVMNQELKQQPSREPALVLAQPKGEPEVNAGNWGRFMTRLWRQQKPARRENGSTETPVAAAQ